MDSNTYDRAIHSLRERLKRLQNEIIESTAPTPLREEPENVDFEPEDMTARQPQIIASKKTQIKQILMQTIDSNQKSTIALKKKLVDEQKLCSKASFYRYVNELKKQNKITSMKIEDTEYCVKIEK